MAYTQEVGCCGIDEIVNLSNNESRPKFQLIEILTGLMDNAGTLLEEGRYGGDWPYQKFIKGKPLPFNEESHPGAALFFTGAVKPPKKEADYARKFHAYIKRHRLGSVVRSKTAISTRHGNNITVYVWTLDKPALTKWWAKNVEKKDGSRKLHRDPDNDADYDDDDYD